MQTVYSFKFMLLLLLFVLFFSFPACFSHLIPMKPLDVLSNQHIFYINSFTYFTLVNYYAGEFFSPQYWRISLWGLFPQAFILIGRFCPMQIPFVSWHEGEAIVDSVTTSVLLHPLSRKFEQSTETEYFRKPSFNF